MFSKKHISKLSKPLTIRKYAGIDPTLEKEHPISATISISAEEGGDGNNYQDDMDTVMISMTGGGSRDVGI